jgi:hypothetical protein
MEKAMSPAVKKSPLNNKEETLDPVIELLPKEIVQEKGSDLLEED